MPNRCHLRLSVLRAVLLLSGLSLMVSLVQAAQVQLSWTAPTTNANGTPLQDLSGYLLYYGTASRMYSTHVDTGLATSAALSGLTEGQTYYFAVTAYDTLGNESQYSEEVSTTIPVAPPPTTPPTATITAPLNGAAVARKSTVTITATASATGSVTRVDFFVSGQLTCTDTTATYTCAWTVPATGGNKTYGLQAKAVDAQGNVGASSVVTVTAQ
jgi:Bacterial Ig domain/Fibronectin type III domain